MPAPTLSDTGKTLVFPVALVLDYQAGNTASGRVGGWRLIGAVAGQHGLSPGRVVTRMHKNDTSEQVLCAGYSLTLHRDDAESYYCNLMGEKPSLFVICREQPGERPEPARVTASYGEAASYSEVDESVHAIAIPPEIYRWIEAYVLEYYVPEKHRKRKRDNWKKDESRP